MNKNFDIKKYLQTVYSLESSLYELKNVRQMLNNKINTYRKGLSILNTTAYNSDGTLDEIGTLANIYTLEETPFYNLKKEESMPRFFWYFDSEFLTTAICLSLIHISGNNFDLNMLVEVIKNIDLNALSNSLNSIEKVLNVVNTFLDKREPEKEKKWYDG